MKRVIGQALLGGCVIFTIWSGISLVVTLVIQPFAGWYIPMGILGISLWMGLCQQVFFTDKWIKLLHYWQRVALFGGAILIPLAVFMYASSLVPRDSLGAWITFFAVFFASLFVSSAGCYFFQKRHSEVLNAALKAHKEQQKAASK